MIRWIKSILASGDRDPCQRDCKWENFESYEISVEVQGRKRVVGRTYVLRCSLCGDLKNHQARP